MKVALILFTSFLFLNVGCDAQSKVDAGKKGEPVNAKITFIELGSVNCIPCKQMQPVMKAIEEKYGDQVKVVFHDVWKSEGKPYAEKYGIRLIPTQVFLDDKGNEFHRHEGFYPESEIDNILQERGLNPVKKEG